MNKKISAIITTYNRANIVRDAIASVFSQTYPVSELIVVDDGSYDDSEKAISDTFENAPIPARYIFKPNGGMATSLNHGIKEAQFDWIAFLDDDDMWNEKHIEKSINLLNATPSSECVISLRDEKGKTQVPPKKLLKPYEKHPTLENVLLHRKSSLTSPFFTSTVGTCLIHRDLARKILFDPDTGARLDIHFFWRVSEYTDIVLHMETHGIGRQFRTSYLSTDDEAPQELKNEITLRRNSDEIRMLTKLLRNRGALEARVFTEQLKQALIGRVYLNRKCGNFYESFHFLFDSIRDIPIHIAVKEFLLIILRIKS